MKRFVFALALFAGTSAAEESRLAIVGGTLIDGHGGPPVHDAVVV